MSNEKFLNTAEQLSSIVDKTSLLESVMDQVIELYCEPRSEAYPFFVQVLLHSSIMPLGSKVKLISVIAQELNFELNRTALHELVATRNAFAHHPLDSHPTFRHGQDKEIRYTLAVITNSGKIKRTDRAHALAEFNKIFAPALTSIYSLLEKVQEDVESTPADYDEFH